MAESRRNGGLVTKEDPRYQKVIALREECRREGRKYPTRYVDDLYAQPFFRLGSIPYHAETLENLRLSREGRYKPVPLPSGMMLNGDERLPGETKWQFAKYLAYRDCGPERTLRSAALAYGAPPNQSGGPGLNWSILAARYRWAERVAAWDAQLEVAARVSQQEQSEAQVEEYIDRRQVYFDQQIALVEKVQEKLHQMLDLPIVRKRYEENGKVIIYEPVRWSMGDVSKLLSTADNILRLYYGLSTSNASLKAETTVTTAAVSGNMSPEDRLAHEYAARKAETAYFDALEEFKHRGDPVITAHVSSAAD